MQKADKVIYLANKLGSNLLESGAETYRVEDTICRILESFGMKDMNCFSMPTGIITSCRYDGDSYSQVARIKNHTTNLDRIDKLNQLSRDSANIDIEEFEKRLDSILNEKPYSNLKTIFYGGVTAFGFTLLFQGAIFDSIVAFILGMMVRFFTIKLENKKMHSFFNISWCSFSVTIIAAILAYFNIIASQDTVVIGTIMLLVPGLAITNAIRDFLAGDLVSGSARCFEAFLVAVAVALGSGIAMTIWLELGGIL